MDQSNKRGMESGSQKQATTRHGYQPAPETSPVAGAYGKRGNTAGDVGTEQTAHRTEKGEREKVDES